MIVSPHVKGRFLCSLLGAAGSVGEHASLRPTKATLRAQEASPALVEKLGSNYEIPSSLSPRVSTVATDGSQPPAARQKRGDTHG